MAKMYAPSQVLREAEARAAAVDAEWAQLQPQLARDPQRYPPGTLPLLHLPRGRVTRHIVPLYSPLQAAGIASV